MINEMEKLHMTIKIDNNQDLLFGKLLAMGNRIQTIGDNFFEEITYKQWFVLVVISYFDNDPTLNELADAVGNSHQNVKQIVLKLARVGFVQIYTDEEDRRKLRVKLTDKSYELKEKYRQKEKEFLISFYQDISEEEINNATETIVKLEENLINMKA